MTVPVGAERHALFRVWAKADRVVQLPPREFQPHGAASLARRKGSQRDMRPCAQARAESSPDIRTDDPNRRGRDAEHKRNGLGIAIDPLRLVPERQVVSFQSATVACSSMTLWCSRGST